VKSGTSSQKKRSCKCPIHIEGTLGQECIKPHSLNLVDWSAASKVKAQWEAAGTTKTTEQKRLKDAVTRYLANCRSRKQSPSTLDKKEKLLERLQRFTGDVTMNQIDFDTLTRFQETWKTWGALLQVKQVERLRHFFKFASKNKWCENIADDLETPEVDPVDKPMVFTDDELKKIQAAIKRPIMRAFVLTLQYTGLRISDAVQLHEDLIHDGKLSILTKKKRTRVELPLPPILLSAIEAIPRTGGYFFWTGQSKLSTVIGSKRRGLAKLLNRAGVKGSPHKYRHTLASNLLANGSTPAMVARILGNSEKIVLKVYSHMIPAIQKQIATELERVWR
jgi:integrase